jgi:ribosomal protein L11 methyltransferase
MSPTVRLRVAVAADQEDALAGWLWTHGGQGLVWEEPAGADPTTIAAWLFFDAGASPDPALLSTLAEWCPGARADALEAVEERDWLAAWRAHADPIEIGRRFLIDPREPEETPAPPEAGDRFLLRLPARTAFGVGSHESTRLALELLEATGCAGARVLDVGTGTGILAFAAQLLGAAHVVAFDVDPAAALLCDQYRRMNGLRRVPVFCGSLGALSIEGTRLRFDLALVNVVPSEIGPELKLLAAALRPGGAALFSGILAEEAPAAKEQVARHGFRPTGERSVGEWFAFSAELAR